MTLVQLFGLLYFGFGFRRFSVFLVFGFPRLVFSEFHSMFYITVPHIIIYKSRNEYNMGLTIANKYYEVNFFSKCSKNVSLLWLL